MSSQNRIEWIKGPVCGVGNCRSQLWRKIDGLQYCQNGHQQEGLVETGEDEDDFTMSQGRAIRVKTVAPRDKSKESPIFYGQKGFRVFLQCYQLHLRNQVSYLIRHKGAPPELEDVVKGLWILYIEARGLNNVNMQMTGHESDSEEEDLESTSSSTVSSSRWRTPPSIMIQDDDELEIMSQDSSDDEYENMLSSSDSDRQDDHDIDSRNAQKNMEKLSLNDLPDMTKTRSPFIQIRPAESVVLCYLACRILKLPIFLCDIYRDIRNMKFPYMKAIDAIPYSIRSHLSLKYYEVFRPRNYPVPGVFHKFTNYMAGMLYNKRGLLVNPPVYSLLSYRFVYDLFLPVEIYQAATRLSNLLEIDFTFESLRQNLRSSYNPEVKILALIVVATKLCYGLDGIIRIPTNSSDAAAQQIDWQLWKSKLYDIWIKEDWHHTDQGTFQQSLLGDVTERGRLSYVQAEFEYPTDDVAFWSNEQIDRFLEFYKNTWILDETNDNDKAFLPPREFLNMFPLNSGSKNGENSHISSESLRETLILIQSRTRSIFHKSTSLQNPRPGQHYSMFGINRDAPSDEAASKYTDIMKVFLVASSKVAGCSITQLLQAIWFIESKCSLAIKQ
ncbi:hypothetical protein V1511DRAFT_234221 [Dipodascopsis uninucleata]